VSGALGINRQKIKGHAWEVKRLDVALGGEFPPRRTHIKEHVGTVVECLNDGLGHEWAVGALGRFTRTRYDLRTKYIS
jgi:hypothetical protein